jgi:glycosyltransferase involved in cell wall biosynthesis
MKDPFFLLSIIIPVYNAKNYILLTLDSILKNDINCFEIIIIDDGSTDGSYEIIDSYIDELSSSLKKNIKLHSQINKGVSFTRNKGIEIATGQYIAFIDADDLISEQYVIKILEIINEYRPDIIQFDFQLYIDSNSKCFKSGLRMVTNGFVSNDSNIISEVFNYNSWYPWSRVYKKELISKYEFPVGLTFEDPSVIPFVFIDAQNIFFMSDSLYFYRHNLSSITNSSSLDTLKLNYKSINFLLKKYIKSFSDDKIFYVPFLHFFRIYLDYSFKIGGFKLLKKSWNEFYFFMNLHMNSNSINNLAGIIFLKIRFLGPYSYFVMSLLSKLNNLKNKT